MILLFDNVRIKYWQLLSNNFEIIIVQLKYCLNSLIFYPYFHPDNTFILRCMLRISSVLTLSKTRYGKARGQV
jgi:hypothetical protein